MLFLKINKRKQKIEIRETNNKVVRPLSRKTLSLAPLKLPVSLSRCSPSLSMSLSISNLTQSLTLPTSLSQPRHSQFQSHQTLFQSHVLKLSFLSQNPLKHRLSNKAQSATSQNPWFPKENWTGRLTFDGGGELR